MKAIRILGLVLAAACWTAFCGTPVAGQEPGPTEPQVTTPDSPPAPAGTMPSDQGGTPATKTGPRFPWPFRLGLFSRSQKGQTAGNGVSTSEDGTTLSRQHVVTTPHGQMTQTWEGSKTDEGYSLSRQQTWTAPDGTLVREHEASISGTDPLNFEREKTITLRDGRTIEHTTSQSWDGQTLQRERTFSGPNGQTRSSQQTLSWDGQGDPPEGGQPTMSRTPATTGGEGSRPAASRPSGFTLGSSARGNWGASGNGVVRRQAGEPESAPVKARRTQTEHRQRLASRPDREPRPHPGPRR